MNLVGKILISSVTIFLVGDVADTFRETRDINLKRPIGVEIKYPDQANVITADGMKYVFNCSREDSHKRCIEYKKISPSR